MYVSRKFSYIHINYIINIKIRIYVYTYEKNMLRIHVITFLQVI